MKSLKEIIIEWLIFINKIAVLIFFCFGVDYISNKYNIPWQIISIIILVVFVIENTQKDKKRKAENERCKNKLQNCLNDSQFDCITIEQKYRIVESISEKEYKGIFR